MAYTKESKWFCEHASSLERFSGRWIAFGTKNGVVSDGDKLEKVLAIAKRRGHIESPFVFHVPSKDELKAPRV